MAKTHSIRNKKRLPWCELIRIIFFIVNVFHHRPTSRKTSRWDVEAPETLQYSASVSEAATSRLGLGNMGLGSRLGLGSEGLVHIPDSYYPTVSDVFLSSDGKLFHSDRPARSVHPHQHQDTTSPNSDALPFHSSLPFSPLSRPIPYFPPFSILSFPSVLSLSIPLEVEPLESS